MWSRSLRMLRFLRLMRMLRMVKLRRINEVFQEFFQLQAGRVKGRTFNVKHAYGGYIVVKPGDECEKNHEKPLLRLMMLIIVDDPTLIYCGLFHTPIEGSLPTSTKE